MQSVKEKGNALLKWLSSDEQPAVLEEYNEQLVRRHIEKVTVVDERLNVKFKSGVEIKIDL